MPIKQNTAQYTVVVKNSRDRINQIVQALAKERINIRGVLYGAMNREKHCRLTLTVDKSERAERLLSEFAEPSLSKR